MMRQVLMSLFSLGLLASTLPLQAMTPKERSDIITQAVNAVHARHPEQAIDLVDTVLKDFEASRAPDTVYFCVTSQTDVILISAMQAKLGKRPIIFIDDGACSAAFLRGFALVDLNRSAEAAPFLKQAEEMEPLSVHYMNEYAEWHKSNKQWQRAFDLFKEAEVRALMSTSDGKAHPHARALRGMGFCLIEMGRLDEAEAKFSESLKFQPDSEAAATELAYIKRLREKAVRTN
jgi:tetratricopeptide (TPR) repeat protein